MAGSVKNPKGNSVKSKKPKSKKRPSVLGKRFKEDRSQEEEKKAIRKRDLKRKEEPK